jgi:serine phosphatase RsbU (regulator of sigma subunit)
MAVGGGSGKLWLRRLSVAVALAGFVLTGLLVWTASSVNHNTNRRLLQLQVRQAAAAVGAALPSVQSQLADALQVEADTSRPASFERFASSKVGTKGPFRSISLWRTSPTGTHLLALAGVRPLIVADGKARVFFSHLRPLGVLQVTGILSGRPPRLGFAEMPPGDTDLIAYAETMLPAKRRVAMPKTSAFDDLNFAIYLGRAQTSSQLIEASLPTPVKGLHSMATVAFGDTIVTLVGAPTTQLAGGLSASLPWIVLGVGVLVSLLSASAVEYIVRRRHLAEDLAKENERLYVEQRDIAGTLQHALLPEVPNLNGIEVAARYFPGVAGIDVGGDWYDVIRVGPDRFVFVVGDVSGRGLHAATTMASLRYATRAYVAQGDGPATVLAKLGRVLDFDSAHQFATVMAGAIDSPERRVTLASAGHFSPLLLSGKVARFLDVPVNTPIGLEPSGPWQEACFTVPDGATLIGFTDGLVERRGEHLDDSLERLRRAAQGEGGPIDGVLDRLASQMVPEGAADDVVILGLRWQN